MLTGLKEGGKELNGEEIRESRAAILARLEATKGPLPKRGEVTATDEVEDFVVPISELEQKRRAELWIKATSGCVYLAHSERQGLYKIGFTSSSVNSRISQLRVGCPDLHLVDAFRGGRKMERFLHRILQRERQEGEWFDLGYDAHERVKDLVATFEIAYCVLLEETVQFVRQRAGRPRQDYKALAAHFVQEKEKT